MKSISFFNTYISPSAKLFINDVLESTFLSEGKIVKQFEEQLIKELQWKNPIALNSGTSALHLALVLAGVQSGDEVIIPAQTFIATGLAVLHTGAVPVFADIQYETGNISPISIKEKITDKTKAIISVHWGGMPSDLDEINSLAKVHGLKVIEDAAHAPGATYKNLPIGSISDFTCFSFQAIKHITTGDGGTLCCKNKKDFDLGMAKRWFGIDRKNTQPSILGERNYNVSNIGYKYHLNDYAAALGLANLQTFKLRLADRRKLANIYKTELKPLSGIQLFDHDHNKESAYWLFGIHVEERKKFVLHMKKHQIVVSVVHQRIDKNSIFGKNQSHLKNQTKFDESQIHIPIHDGLKEEDIGYILDVIKKGW